MKKFQVKFHPPSVDLTGTRAFPSRAEFDTLRRASEYIGGRRGGYIYRVQQAENGAHIYTRRLKLQ